VRNIADRVAAGLRPVAVVYLEVPECRLQKKYFLAWWFDKARADLRAFGIPSDTKWRLIGIPLVLFRGLIVWTLRLMVVVEPAQRFCCKLKVWGWLGRFLSPTARPVMQRYEEINARLNICL